MTDVKFILIDLFCGAGGTSTGAVKSGVCKVAVAVNHDPVAIRSHSANHQETYHIREDVLLVDISRVLKVIIDLKKKYPNARVILWASLECTHFSNAKGGGPRDADSRSLANGMFRYLEALPIDYFLVENVREFMSWGPLIPKVVKSADGHYCPIIYNKKGKVKPHMVPESKTAGRYYLRWVNRIKSMGYDFDWRLLNAANFGGVTTRTRYFAGFWKKGLSFAWPEPTHAKKIEHTGLFENRLKPWRPVSEVLDFTDLGYSIFDREIPLVDNTIRRIHSGLKKFHSDSHIMVCNTPGYCHSVKIPIGTVTTTNRHAMLTPMIMSYYGNGNSRQIYSPAPTVRTTDSMSLVIPWISRDFKNGSNQSAMQPAGTLLTVPKINLCSAWIVNPQFNNAGNSIANPAPTVIASQHGRPLGLATAFRGVRPRWEIEPGDSAARIELKNYMRSIGVADIYMRMLKTTELKLIQGFPFDYVLTGTVEDQKKHIGNSVETTVVQKWMLAIANEIQ